MQVRTHRWRLAAITLFTVAATTGGAALNRANGAGAATPSAARGVSQAINPIRILETRGGDSGGPTGVTTVGPVTAGQVLQLQVSGAVGQGATPVPGHLVGANLNVTALNATANTFIRLYPCDGPQPSSSTLNPAPGVVGYNSALVALSADGKVCIFNHAGTVDLIVDVTGVQYDLAASLHPSPVRIDAAQFRPADGKAQWIIGAGWADATVLGDPGFPVDACFVAPVDLPGGAVLSEVRVFAREGNPAAANVVATLSSRAFGKTDSPQAIGMWDNSAGIVFDTDLSLSLGDVSGHVVDGARVYELYVCININDTLMGAQVTYTGA